MYTDGRQRAKEPEQLVQMEPELRQGRRKERHPSAARKHKDESNNPKWGVAMSILQRAKGKPRQWLAQSWESPTSPANYASTPGRKVDGEELR